jgi:hypothetical protein
MSARTQVIHSIELDHALDAFATGTVREHAAELTTAAFAFRPSWAQRRLNRSIRTAVRRMVRKPYGSPEWERAQRVFHRQLPMAMSHRDAETRLRSWMAG